jgi:hypothetical protein
MDANAAKVSRSRAPRRGFNHKLCGHAHQYHGIAMIYTHILKRRGRGVRSPADGL